mmetsp:Transcript_37856/g.100777  ORF Transcript_37856/g.100777 Transcript_37856/m.100777 type:complete len:97 (-) Transcript_37856:583-873(-)
MAPSTTTYDNMGAATLAAFVSSRLAFSKCTRWRVTIICSGRGVCQRERGVLRAGLLAKEQRQERVDQLDGRRYFYVSQLSIEDGALELYWTEAWHS